MRVMFAIYCTDKTEVLNLVKKLPTINIKTVLMINVEKNNSLEYLTKKYIINVLCEIKIQIDYMVRAIMEKIEHNNPIVYYFCNYLNEIVN